MSDDDITAAISSDEISLAIYKAGYIHGRYEAAAVPIEAIDYLLDIASWEADVRLFEDSQFPHRKIVNTIKEVRAWLDAQKAKGEAHGTTK